MLTRVTVLCSLAQHFTLTLPLGLGVLLEGSNPAMDWHPIQGEVDEIFLVDDVYTETSLRAGPSRFEDSLLDFTLIYLKQSEWNESLFSYMVYT